MEEAGFMTYTAASQQVAIEKLWLKHNQQKKKNIYYSADFLCTSNYIIVAGWWRVTKQHRQEESPTVELNVYFTLWINMFKSKKNCEWKSLSVEINLLVSVYAVMLCSAGTCTKGRAVPAVLSSCLSATSTMHDGIYCLVSDHLLYTTFHDALWETISALYRV